MGAWSREPFGNDDANDWVYERADAADLSYVEAASLGCSAGGRWLLGSPGGFTRRRGVEVIAKLLGRGTESDAYTEKVDEWVKTVRVKPTRPLLEKAQRALERIRGEQSELKGLWDEGDAAEWDASFSSLPNSVTA